MTPGFIPANLKMLELDLGDVARVGKKWRKKMQFLKVEGLQKSFGGLKAIHDLEFQVEEGEIIGLIGDQ